MTDEDLTNVDPIQVTSKPEPFKWAAIIWIKPAATFRKIIGADGKTWWLPLILLSGLQVIKNLIEIAPRKAAILMTPATVPQGMNYITPEQQSQIDQSLTLKSGPFFTFVIPALAAIAGLWVMWLLISSILHISLTLTGSRSNSGSTFNLTAWASLPLALRLIVQIIAILATGSLITQAGLSGFVTIQGRLTLILSILLGMIDLYFLLQILFMIIGTAQLSGVKAGKSILAVLVSVLFTMVLSTLPGFISYTISGMNITRPFFF